MNDSHFKASLKAPLASASTSAAPQPDPSQKQATLLRIGKVSDASGISRAYIYQLCKEGRFPKPVTLVPGGTSVAWVASEIEAWVNERIAKRDQEV